MSVKAVAVMLSSISASAALTNGSMYRVDVTNAGGNSVSRSMDSDDDALKINAIILSVPDSGGVLFFPAGTYLLRTRVKVYNKKNISFVGEGKSSVFKTLKGTGPYVSNVDFPLFDLFTSTSIVFRELTFIGPGKIYGDPSNPAQGDNCQTPGILIRQSSDSARVSNCDFKNLNSGIRVENSADCQISNNIFHGKIVQDGVQVISLSEVGSSPGKSARNIVSSNTFDFSSDANGSMGIRLAGQSSDWSTLNCTVVGNTIRNAHFEGIVSEFSEGGTITGNTLSSCAYGIQLYDFRKGTVSANTVENCPSVGIGLFSNVGGRAVTGNVVSGNSVINSGTKPGSHAVIVGGESASIADSNMLVNNIIRGGNVNGINLMARNCTIKGNYIQSPGGTGIFMGSAKARNCIIEGNFIMQPGAHGILGGTGSTISGNYIVAKALPAANTGGIWLEGYPDVTVTGNKVSGFGAFNEFIPKPKDNGIAMPGNSSGTSLKGGNYNNGSPEMVLPGGKVGIGTIVPTTSLDKKPGR
ncbi:MAG: right-handed parallel beta-helix repeat-containing protein [Fibrobacteria bacterium]